METYNQTCQRGGKQALKRCNYSHNKMHGRKHSKMHQVKHEEKCDAMFDKLQTESQINIGSCRLAPLLTSYIALLTRRAGRERNMKASMQEIVKHRNGIRN